MKTYCDYCKKYTEHKQVPASMDKKNGWKQDIKTQGGCRDFKADYRTIQCQECDEIRTYDFATD